MMFNNLLFGFFWAGFQLSRWKIVASWPLESMAGLNLPFRSGIDLMKHKSDMHFFDLQVETKKNFKN